MVSHMVPMTSPDDASLSYQLLEGVAEEGCSKVQHQPEQLRDALSQKDMKRELGREFSSKALVQRISEGLGRGPGLEHLPRKHEGPMSHL